MPTIAGTTEIIPAIVRDKGGAVLHIAHPEYAATLDGTTNNDAIIQAAVDANVGKNVRIVIPPLCKYTNAVNWKGVQYENQNLVSRINAVTVPSGSTNAGMCSDGTIQYVCGYTNHNVVLFDVSDRRNPRFISTISTGASTNPRSVLVCGEYLLLCCLGSSKVQVRDRRANSLALTFEFAVGTTPKDFCLVDGRHLYVICNSGFLEKWELDFANLTARRMWRTATVGATPLHVSHYNGILFVVGASAIVDVFSASSGVRIGGYEIVGSTNSSITVPVGRYLFVVTAGSVGGVSDRLYVLDVKDPTAPTLTTSIAVSNEPAWMVPHGTLLLISGLVSGAPGTLDVVDFTDPAAPVLVKTLASTAAGPCFSNIVDRFLYQNGHDTPFVIDVYELPEVPKRTPIAEPIDVLLNPARPVATKTGGYTAVMDVDEIIRVGLGATITLPDPATFRQGAHLLIVNVSTSAISTITNGYAGYVGAVGPLQAVTLKSTTFSGTSQWEGASNYTLPAIYGVSADRGDASVTINPNADYTTQRFATALTVNRTVTLGTTGAVKGSKFRVVRTGLGAFTLAVGALKTIPSATAAYVDVEYDGSAWILTGYGTL